MSSIKNVKNTRVELSAFQTLLKNKPAWGQYDAVNFSGTTLIDMTSNGRNGTTVNITSGSASGNGASVSIPYIKGTPTSTVVFPTGSIPTQYTIASLTRFETTGSKHRILQGTGNWLHGHYGLGGNGANGTAFYEGWRTAQTYTGQSAGWVNFVATNGITGYTIPNNIIYNGTAVSNALGGTGNKQLAINCLGICPEETSDFQFSQLIIWDQVLTPAELIVVSTALTTYLSTGILQ